MSNLKHDVDNYKEVLNQIILIWFSRDEWIHLLPLRGIFLITWTLGWLLCHDLAFMQRKDHASSVFKILFLELEKRSLYFTLGKIINKIFGLILKSISEKKLYIPCYPIGVAWKIGEIKLFEYKITPIQTYDFMNCREDVKVCFITIPALINRAIVFW